MGNLCEAALNFLSPFPCHTSTPFPLWVPIPVCVERPLWHQSAAACCLSLLTPLSLNVQPLFEGAPFPLPPQACPPLPTSLTFLLAAVVVTWHTCSVLTLLGFAPLQPPESQSPLSRCPYPQFKLLSPLLPHITKCFPVGPCLQYLTLQAWSPAPLPTHLYLP